MAKVFLSYAREDEPAAKQLAESIGRAGHDVWWDRHIQGGSRFSTEIDRELKSAEAVVVLWSPLSVESAWVQDEAAEGRDTNRLVPVSLNGSRPPLGFRQFHTVWPNGTATANPTSSAICSRQSPKPPVIMRPPRRRRRSPKRNRPAPRSASCRSSI